MRRAEHTQSEMDLEDIHVLLGSHQEELSLIQEILFNAAHGHEPRTLAVTSALAREGKTTIAVIMAKSLVMHSHARVLLIDGNEHHPALHDLFECRQSPGLVDAILDEEALFTPQASDLDGLDILTFGLQHDRMGTLYRSPRFAEMIATMQEKYDYVIMDGAAVH
ncbi:MAG: hypothetical protein HQL50_00370, partial [Magnetococcales bacterium]|nr:hypothetical protein [Magnetococcales bacterium]